MTSRVAALAGLVVMMACAPSSFAADDTLMDIMYRDSRAVHLDRIETQRIQYEERAVSYLDQLYNATFDFSDPALESMEFEKHQDDVKVPPKPGDTALNVDTAATAKATTVETKSGSRFSSGGSLDVTTP